jgi:hypothetical protein
MRILDPPKAEGNNVPVIDINHRLQEECQPGNDPGDDENWYDRLPRSLLLPPTPSSGVLRR